MDKKSSKKLKPINSKKIANNDKTEKPKKKKDLNKKSTEQLEKNKNTLKDSHVNKNIHGKVKSKKFNKG